LQFTTTTFRKPNRFALWLVQVSALALVAWIQLKLHFNYVWLTNITDNHQSLLTQRLRSSGMKKSIMEVVGVTNILGRLRPKAALELNR